MPKLIPALTLLFFVASFQPVNAQETDKEKAFSKCQKAIDLMDQGKFDESIPLLKEAQKLDPGSSLYPYELAYAYYSKQDYKTAADYLESILKHKDVSDRVYQLLGNTYDYLGKAEKAIKTYESGLKLFPNSGVLHLEMGVMQMGKEDYNKALEFYEKGISVALTFPSNFYWAARIYCSSTDEVWGMIYGEIFMNLERNTKRTSEISKLLYDTYQSQIKFTSDTSFTVSFSQNSLLSLLSLANNDKPKLPFGIGVYEPTLMFSLFSEKTINLTTLNRIRTAFVDLYFSKGHDKTYPNVLFAYQKEVKDAGHIDAYNHWILMKGDENAFVKWQSENSTKWDAFIDWFTENPMKLDKSNVFHRAQY